MERCIFCGYNNIKIIDENYTKRVECPLCIEYKISREAFDDKIADKISKEDRALFSGYLRQHAIENEPLELVSKDILNIPQAVSIYNKLTVSDKIKSVILYLGKTSKYIGQYVPFDMSTLYTAFFCKDFVELKNIVAYLEQKKFIGRANIPAGPVVKLTIGGWTEHEKIKEINVNSKKAFIAMNFDRKLDYVYTEAIEPACDVCGFKAVRVDLIEHNEKICDRIISEIKDSRFAVADFTGQKYGVYFEAGYAYGLGLPVIWTCKKGEKLHFDTRQYNHIFWEDAKDLEKQLISRIKITITGNK